MKKGDPAKFITRGTHEQHACYPEWLASVFSRLYESPPKTARELIEFSAKYMQPSSDWGLFRRIELSGRKKIARLGISDRNIFGPVTVPDYGMINKDRQSFDTDARERCYNDTIARNYPNEITTDRVFVTKSFNYDIPNKREKLQLMQLGLVHNMPEPTDIPMLMIDESNALIFRHPQLTPQIYEDFVACLEPLFSTIHSKSVTFEQKEEAVISFFWLMAQMTPVSRGGTAHARIALEYLASEIGMQVPHTKEGYDLWAEAACVDLESFKANFRSGRFFDRNITSDQVLEWQCARITQNRGSMRGAG